GARGGGSRAGYSPASAAVGRGRRTAESLAGGAATGTLRISPPYQTRTSNWGVGHQVPLGLLMVGGPLRDAGHEIRLLDAECRRLAPTAVLRAVKAFRPELVMTGHAGSTPGHPVCVDMLRAIKASFPGVRTVYGGVYRS